MSSETALVGHVKDSIVNRRKPDLSEELLIDNDDYTPLFGTSADNKLVEINQPGKQTMKSKFSYVIKNQPLLVAGM